ncbi:hypothetical protein [Saccharicrinis sp. GN24d3]|uniref:hypothetical protein n=1 Tax=Saccharicrinis sp. GN24d3 TaxID=3458416 RepID=UPI004036070C
MNLIRLILGMIFLMLLSCESKNVNEVNRLYFEINPTNRKIILPVIINDSTTAKLTFDSGAATGCLHLDSTFCALHPEVLNGIKESFISTGGSGWSSQRTSFSTFDKAPDIKLGLCNLEYDKMSIYNYKDYFRTTESDGMFNIPKNDTLHVWELNFENNYFEIHEAKCFKMPEDCFVTQIINNAGNNCPFNIQLPIFVTCEDGDTISLDRQFMIDTAMSWDIVLMNNAKEKQFFSCKKNNIWTKYLNSYFKYCTVEARVSDKLVFDSLRIYTFNEPNNPNISYFLGQNFLKHFNVYFDLNRQEIGFQPHNNFQRVSNSGYRRYHFLVDKNSQGKYIVSEIADYEGNYYKSAGLRCGDEIVNIDSRPYADYTKVEKLEFYKKDSLIYDLIRDSKPLRLVVKVNKEERQGD